MDQRVATEVAEQEFQRFAETMDLDVDPSSMTEEDRKSFETSKRRLIRAMESGHLVIDDKGQPVYTPRDGGEPITFYEPTGASFMAMDGKPKNADIQKMFAVMADMTRRDAKTFAKLPNRDLKVCQTIAVLFLA